MREIQTQDMFILLRALEAGEVKEKIKKAYMNAGSTQESQESYGMDVVMDFVCGMANTKAEKYLYQFVGGVLEMTPEQVATSDPIDLLNNLQMLFNSIDKEKWKAFFKSVLHLLMRN